MSKKEILLVKNAISKIEVYPYFREVDWYRYSPRIEPKWYRKGREEGFSRTGVFGELFVPIAELEASPEYTIKGSIVSVNPRIDIYLNNGQSYTKYFKTVEELEEYKSMLLSYGMNVITF